MSAATQKLTFAEHIQELRKRLMWSLLFVAIGAGIGYSLHDLILRILQEPLNSSLYYTAPTGAFSFIIKLCVTFGFVAALPVVVYQGFSFFGPLLKKNTKKTIVTYVFISVLLAAAGIAFAYFISLPAALHFLVSFGSGAGDIQAIITADEYFNFVLAYIAGFAALFQLPLIISFINRVTPLKPSQLMGGTRYVILGSFVVAAIITPTPDPLNQALMAGPIILLYFTSVVVISLANIVGRRKIPSPATQAAEAKDINKPALMQRPQTQNVQWKPAQAQTPKLTPAANSTIRRRPVQRRMVTDMVVGGSRPQVALAPPRPQRNKTQQTRPQTPERPSMQLISDFMPPRTDLV